MGIGIIILYYIDIYSKNILWIKKRVIPRAGPASPNPFGYAEIQLSAHREAANMGWGPQMKAIWKKRAEHRNGKAFRVAEGTGLEPAYTGG